MHIEFASLNAHRASARLRRLPVLLAWTLAMILQLAYLLEMILSITQPSLHTIRPHSNLIETAD